MSPTYVIGHVNPDMDSIASAIGYAWFLRESEGGEIIPARAGAINPQTTWVLNRLGIAPPMLLTDASPRFEVVARRLDTAEPDSPLRDAWAILTRTGGIVPIVDPEDGSPFGLITGFSLFKYLSEYVGPHPRSQEMRIAELLDLPSREACDTKVPKFQASIRIRDVLNRILREEHNDFIIVDEQGVYLGVARQRDVLNPPRMRIILVDHNEPGQSLGAIEEAELVEIFGDEPLAERMYRTDISTLKQHKLITNMLVAALFECGLQLFGYAGAHLLSRHIGKSQYEYAPDIGAYCFVSHDIDASAR